METDDGFSFLGLPFRRLTLSDGKRLIPFLRRHPQPLTGYSFNSLVCWAAAFRYGVFFDESLGRLLISFTDPDSGETHLLQPLGDFSDGEILKLAESARALPYSFQILGVSRPFLESHPRILEAFDVCERRDFANYVYETEKLANLPGRQLSKKRNLISQARRLYEWQARDMRPQDAPACLELARRIARDEAPHRDASWARELDALTFALTHFGELTHRGTVVLASSKSSAESPEEAEALSESEILAFALWEPNGPETAITHFERATRRFKGLYQVINMETARQLAAEGIRLVNREEDMGEAGLRQAKLSYPPFCLQPSAVLRVKV